MNILGISGIDGTIAFKRRHWPELEEREYRISQGHDSAAALVIDGEVVAALAEERISRRKHTGDFPTGAIGACLAQAGIGPEQLDEVAHGFDYGPYGAIYSLDPISSELHRDVLSREAFARHVRNALPELPPERIHHVDHHLAHAASAYLTSGWDECLVVVVDGMGEAHGATVYRARNGQLEPLHRIAAADSIGIFYSLVTFHLGFDFNADEYQVMGLAPYGEPSRFSQFFEHAVTLREGDGGWQIPLLHLARSRDERENHTASRRFLSEHLIPPRAPGEDITSDHEDVAAALQATLDRAMLHLCGHWGRRTQLRHVALAGGVALNTTANARLIGAGIFDEVYVQPAAADDGTSLGAALQRSAAHGEAKNRRSPTPFYGPAHGEDDVDAGLARFAKELEITQLESLEQTCETTADLIVGGHVVAWYRGRMEFGPRALGHRSILADPSRPEMRGHINAMVKMREAFRPFAPAVSIENVHRFFEVAPGTALPYMNANVSVRPEQRTLLPAVTHVDGSARVQTVSSTDNGDFHALLRAIGRRTGREVVLNTSFNASGEPIVNTPAEAIETFLGTGIEALLLENTLVRKR